MPAASIAGQIHQKSFCRRPTVTAAPESLIGSCDFSHARLMPLAFAESRYRVARDGDDGDDGDRDDRPEGHVPALQHGNEQADDRLWRWPHRSLLTSPGRCNSWDAERYQRARPGGHTLSVKAKSRDGPASHRDHDQKYYTSLRYIHVPGRYPQREYRGVSARRACPDDRFAPASGRVSQTDSAVPCMHAPGMAEAWRPLLDGPWRGCTTDLHGCGDWRLTPEQIIAVDGAHLWHPYSPSAGSRKPVVPSPPTERG